MQTNSIAGGAARRGFLKSMAAYGAAVLAPEILAAAQHAHKTMHGAAPVKLKYLDFQTAAELEAITSGIIPSGATPGAKEAGVVYFIDHALAGFLHDARPVYRKGMEEARNQSRRMFPSSSSIAALSADELARLLESIEKTEFFEAVRTHTIMGFLASPAHGGNRGEAGWKLIGLEMRDRWEPPFGFYDDPRNSL